jgi:hypothetical protein
MSRLSNRGFARLSLLPVLAALGFAASPPPSDPVAVYAIVDRVVLTPDTIAPTAIQVHGIFSVSAQEPGDNYAPAARGYLYFSLDQSKASVNRAEWADLRRIAGTKQVVGFGAKYAKPLVRIRCATEPVTAPDMYQTGIVVVKAIFASNTMNAQIASGLRSANVPAARCKS